jgi:hypothetical protein
MQGASTLAAAFTWRPQCLQHVRERGARRRPVAGATGSSSAGCAATNPRPVHIGGPAPAASVPAPSLPAAPVSSIPEVRTPQKVPEVRQPSVPCPVSRRCRLPDRRPRISFGPTGANGAVRPGGRSASRSRTHQAESPRDPPPAPAPRAHPLPEPGELLRAAG